LFRIDYEERSKREKFKYKRESGKIFWNDLKELSERVKEGIEYVNGFNKRNKRKK
jgi:hypothetical protein